MNTTGKSFAQRSIAGILVVSFSFTTLAFADPDIATLNFQSRWKPLQDETLLPVHAVRLELFLGLRQILAGHSLREVNENLSSMFEAHNQTLPTDAERLHRSIAFVDFNRNARNGPASVIFTVTNGTLRGQIFELKYWNPNLRQASPPETVTPLFENGNVFEEGDYCAITRRLDLEARYAAYVTTLIAAIAARSAARGSRMRAGTRTSTSGAVERFAESSDVVIDPSLTTMENLVREGKIDEFVERALWAKEAGAGSVHLDIFDPNYVRTKDDTGNMDVFTPDVVRALKAKVDLPVVAHLMVSPESLKMGIQKYVEGFIDAGVDFITLHWSAFRDKGLLLKALEFIRGKGCYAGVAFNPDEDVREFESYQDACDYILVMSVIPGMGGRGLEERALENLVTLTGMETGKLVAVDGAITDETIGRVAAFGGKWLCSGSFYFGKYGELKTKEGIREAHRRLIDASRQSPDTRPAGLREEPLPSEPIDREIHEVLIDLFTRTSTLLAKRKQAADPAEVRKLVAQMQDEVRKARMRIGAFSRRTPRRTAIAEQILESRHQAYEHVKRAEAMVARPNEPAALKAFEGALNDIQRARDQAIEYRLARQEKIQRVRIERDSVSLMQQGYTLVKKARVPFGNYAPRKYETLWQVFRSLDDQRRTELDDHLFLRQARATIRKLIPRINRGVPLDIDRELRDISRMLNPKRGDIKAEQKRLGRIYIREAIELYKAGNTKTACEFLKKASELFQSRIEEIERILSNLEAGHLRVMRVRAKVWNNQLRDLARIALEDLRAGRWSDVEAGIQELLGHRSIDEPQFHGLKLLLERTLIAFRSDRVEHARYVRYNLELIQRKANEANRLADFMEKFRTSWVRARLSANIATDTAFLEESIFTSCFNELARRCGYARGSPEEEALWTRCFQPAFISTTTKPRPQRTKAIDNPLFWAVSDLIVLQEVINFSRVLNEYRERLPETHRVLSGFIEEVRRHPPQRPTRSISYRELDADQKLQLLKALADDHGLDNAQRHTLYTQAVTPRSLTSTLRGGKAGEAEGQGGPRRVSTSGAPKRTVLYDEHMRLGAKPSIFGGWEMPGFYESATEENRHTREHASIFDESHMGLIEIKGSESAKFIDYVSSPNVNRDGSIRPFRAGDVQYRFLLDENADIIDDIQVAKLADDHFILIVNAGNTDKVKRWFSEKVRAPVSGPQGFRCEITDLREAPKREDQRIIVALQGTMEAEKILQRLTTFDLEGVGYFKCAYVDLTIDGKTVRRLIQRTGYTGEDGFEIHLHPDEALAFWRKVIELGAKPAGLAARDSLRLEAGLPLYGHEWRQEGGPMPFEYRYGFALDLREDGPEYIGKTRAIEKHKASTKALVGIRVIETDTASRPPRTNYKVYDENGNEVGYVTSDSVRSPTLNATISMAYIEKGCAEIGRELTIRPEDEDESARRKTGTLVKVVETPFISHIVPDRAKDAREAAPFYLPGGEDERQKKLAVIREKLGIDSIEGLYGPLQEYFYEGSLDLPPPMARRELFRLLYGRSLENRTGLVSFRGAGYYHEPGSDVVAALMSNLDFLTPYTPYGPEVSQGNLRLMFLYQSIMAKLLGMDVVNASLYDGATALAEGVRMACHATGKKKAIVVGAINPYHRQVLDTYARNGGISIYYVPADKRTGRVDIEALGRLVDGKAASVVVQQPNFLGELETEIDKVREIARNKGALLHIHSNDPMTFVRIRPPGSYEADITTAEGQAFVGNPYSGGNSLGIIGCRRRAVDGEELLAYMPGRLVGQTVDSDGNVAFALAITRREQHRGREEASSNICTNAALNAIASAVYILHMGEGRLAANMEISNELAREFAEGVRKIHGFGLFSTGPVMREVVVRSPIPAERLARALMERGIDAGFDISRHFDLGEDLVQFSFTAMNSAKDVRDLLTALEEIARASGATQVSAGLEGAWGEIGAELRRTAPLDIRGVPEPVLRRIIEEQGRFNYTPVKNPYPLGSCTMMYNPDINEQVARLAGFSEPHPYRLPELTQGTLRTLHEFGGYLASITGMDETSLHPAAGAHGELTGLTTILRYHESQGQTQRRYVITPDSSHGTNPASAAMAESDTVKVKTDEVTGRLDLDDLRAVLADPRYKGKIAAIMLTEPNTLGLFEDLKTAADLVHAEGGLVYMDGANLNAIVGRIRPGDFGVDVLHVNLHKTFSTPHGGGGPGAGPICVKSHLAPFLPAPRIVERDGQFTVDYDVPDAIRIGTFLGNIPVFIRAYAYIRALGEEGLRAASGDAVLNANYLLARLKDHFDIPYAPGEPRMHEFVISLQKIREETGVTAMDFAKRLMDYGIHPPTVYFPLIVHEALMIEPTQSMTLEELDKFVEAMIAIKHEAYTNPELVTGAPHRAAPDRAPIGRVKVSEVEKIMDVPLKSSDIHAIVGIGDTELTVEKPRSDEEKAAYENPFDGWETGFGVQLEEATEEEAQAAEAPEGYLTTATHEWYKIVEIGGKRCAVVGIAEYAVFELLYEIIFFELPEVGQEVQPGAECGSLESAKAVEKIYSPVRGKVIKVSRAAVDEPDLVNRDPYGKGWLYVVELEPEEAQAPPAPEAPRHVKRETGYQNPVEGWAVGAEGEPAQRPEGSVEQEGDLWHAFVDIGGKRCAVVGLSRSGADAIGELLYVELPGIGFEAEAGEICGSFESVAAAKDLNSPVTGRVIKRNEAVIDNPELVNEDSYGRGWLFVVELEESGAQGENRTSTSGEAAPSRYPRPRDADTNEAADAIIKSQVELFVPQSFFPKNSLSETRDEFQRGFSGTLRIYKDFAHLASIVENPEKACILLVGQEGLSEELRAAIRENPQLTGARFINVRSVDSEGVDGKERIGYYRRILATMSLARIIDENDIRERSSVYVLLRYYLDSHLPAGCTAEEYLSDLVVSTDNPEEFLTHIAHIIKAILSYRPAAAYDIEEIRQTTQVLWNV